MQRSLIFIVLVLASLHCGRAMLYDNVSYLDLQKYELGQERMPFQGRVLMTPLMRMAHSSAAMIRISRSPHEKRVMTAERPDPEKVLSTLIACACVAGMGLLGTWEAIRLRLPWWLPWTLTLAILFVSYASRSEQNFWYPYDAPEFLLFSLGTVFVVQQRYWPLLLLMPIIAANRETAIFLRSCGCLSTGTGSGPGPRSCEQLCCWCRMRRCSGHRASLRASTVHYRAAHG